jgi:hypothetical protein
MKPFTRIACLVLGMATTGANASRHWDLNDVTVIYPMPRSATEDLAMVRPSDAGPHGELLPKVVAGLFDRIQLPIDTLYPDLRLMSVRLDPCGMKQKAECLPEIRIVWQRLMPVSDGSGMSRTTTTQAFHTFYRLTIEEVAAYGRKLTPLLDRHSPSTRKRPLDIHPAFVRDGINGAFGKDFRKLLSESVGVNKMFRIAAIGTTQGTNPLPSFQGKDLVDGKWVDQDIAGISEAIQSFKVTTGSSRYTFALELIPIPRMDRNLLAMIRDSALQAR